MRRSTYGFSAHLKCRIRVTQGCTNWKIMVTWHLGLNQPLWHSAKACLNLKRRLLCFFWYRVRFHSLASNKLCKKRNNVWGIIYWVSDVCQSCLPNRPMDGPSKNGQTWITLGDPKKVVNESLKKQKPLESKGVQRCPMVNGMNDSRKLRSWRRKKVIGVQLAATPPTGRITSLVRRSGKWENTKAG